MAPSLTAGANESIATTSETVATTSSAPTTNEATTSTLDEATTSTTNEATTSTLDEATTSTLDEATTSTVATTIVSSATDAASDGTITTVARVDESALALIAANLYSIPGRTHACDPEGRREEIFATYVAPARGGDIYAVCIRRSGATDIDVALDPATLRIVDPAGGVVVDVSVEDYEAIGLVTDGMGQNDGAVLVLEDAAGTRRAHGLRLNHINIVTIPLLFRHDRPAGEWGIEYTNSTMNLAATLRIDAPCSHLTSDLSTDPIDFPGDVEFLWTSDADGGFGAPDQMAFEHCRVVPSVVGQPINVASATLVAYGETNDRTPNVIVLPESCPDGVVTQQGPRAFTVYRQALSRFLMGLETGDDLTFRAGVGSAPC